jgi:hypothetical protein
LAEALTSSFRDPSGFLYRQAGHLYRRVNARYREDYDALMESGLYAALAGAGLLIRHEEVPDPSEIAAGAYKILRPEAVPFVSYPFEWCFSQLKDAALATLRAQSVALEHSMCLKDASAYNVQFVGCQAILIDTLSFERLREGEPWVAYRQFCQHFLAPLALMAKTDVRLGQWLRIGIDGVPLDLASRLLPWPTRLNPGIALHLHAHAASQRRFASRERPNSAARMRFGRSALLGLVDSLRRTVEGLRWNPRGTPWAEYGGMTHYSPEESERKAASVRKFLEAVRPASVWDLGANVGAYSRVASGMGILTISFDSDPAAIERSYLEAKRREETKLLPLILDLTNPSPQLGWDLRERDSILERGPAEAVMALALIHHLAISNNVPFGSLARFLARLGRWLIIEFVPKGDPQVQKLLAWREDIFEDYSRESFEAELGRRYRIRESLELTRSGRRLYLMERSSESG